jgi:hypothetical protein
MEVMDKGENMDPQNQNQVDDQNQNGDQNNDQNQQVIDQNQQVQTQEKTFTQSDVTAMMTKEKQEGRNSAYNALGIDPNNKDLVNMVKNFVASQKPANDTDDGSGNSAELEDALRRAHEAEVKVECMAAGAKADILNEVTVLVENTIKENASNGNEMSVSDAVAMLRSKFPDWFVGDDASRQQEANRAKGTGSTVNVTSLQNSDPSKTQPGSIGKRLASSRRANSGKSNYFKN